MPSNQTITKDSCRVCLSPGIYSLDEHTICVEEKKVTLRLALDLFTSLKHIDTISDFPSTICDVCIEALCSAYIFRNKIALVEDRLWCWIQEVTTEQNSNVDTSVELQLDNSDAHDNSTLVESSEVEMLSLASSDDEFLLVESIQNAADTVQPYLHQSEPMNIPRSLRKRKIPNKIAMKKQLKAKSGYEVLAKNSGVMFPQFVITEKLKSDTLTDEVLNPKDDGDLGDESVKVIDLKPVKLSQSPPDYVVSSIREKESGDQTFMCQFCPKAFATSHHLILHTRKSHVCQFCLKSFVKVHDLQAHSKQHISFQCSFCTRVFSNNSNLRAHIRKCHNLKLPAHVSLISIKSIDPDLEKRL